MHQANILGTAFNSLRTVGAGALLAAVVLAGASHAQEYRTGIEWQKPPVVTPGKSPGDPPADAVVLFGGKDLSAWVGGDKWKVADGVATVGSGMIETKEHFGDSQLHIEWSAPTPASGTGQGRGNSGVFFGPYELQVLDSYEDETYFDGQAAAIYKQTPPMVNAMRPPGEWNVYDVLWTAPRFKEDGSLKSPAYITVLHNGVAVLNHFELLGDTPFNRPPQYSQHPPEQPIKLQDHGNPVRFRNIWIRPLKAPAGRQAREPSLTLGERQTPLPGALNKMSGTVTLDGQPVSAGKVTLHAIGGNYTAESAIENGRFTLEVLRPGDYAVTVSEVPTAGGEAGVPAAKLGDPATTPLTVEIQKGENRIDLELPAK